MSEERTAGIVVRTRLLTETSLIVHWLTAEAGRVSTVARGARGAKSVYRGRLDLFQEAELTFRRAKRSDLHTLGEVVPTGTYPELRKDWRRLTQACYGVSLIELTTEEDTPVPETWGLFRAYLATVNRGPSSVLTVYALELRHLADLGQLPDFDRESLGAGSRKLAERLLEAEWGAWLGVEVRSDWVEPLDRFLKGFLGAQLGRLPKGRDEALGADSNPPLPGG
jgi:DNA repair protein RecO